MRILAIHESTVPLAAPMRNASVAFDTMTASALAVISDRRVDGKPVVGYAFDSIGRYGKGGLLRDRFIARLLAAQPDSLLAADGVVDPRACVAALMRNEKDGGHGERPGAVGLVEAAIWDLRAKLKGVPLWRCLADERASATGVGARADGSFRVYGSCGHFRPGRGSTELQGLADEIRQACAAGFTTVKIKLGGASLDDDVARTQAAIRGAEGASRIAVDVNGRLDPRIEEEWFRSMAELDVAWIEEPSSPLDYRRLSAQASLSRVPLATGENLFSFDDARNLLLYGGLKPARDLVQVDISLSYGIGEYQRILGEFESAGWSTRAFRPHAGHLFAAHAVAGLGLGMHESASDLSLPFGGLWDGSEISAGNAQASDLPGVGFEGKARLFEWLRPLGAH